MFPKIYYTTTKHLYSKVTYTLLFFGLLMLTAAPPAISAPTLLGISKQQTATPLRDAIDKIGETYKVSLVYDVDQLKGKSVNNWRISHKSVEEELKGLLNKFSLTFKKLNDSTFVIRKKKTNQAPKKIKTNQKPTPPTIKKEIKAFKATGIIRDIENDDPLIGVNITVKGTTLGTVTDYNGEFSIQVEEGAQLVLSYLSYLTKEVKAQPLMGAIYMEPNARQLDEVVVVGYGTMKRSDLTGSLSSVSEKELKQLPATGLDQALQGRAAGVMVTQNSGAPGGGVSIRVRGIASTFTAEPLYVIDGIPVFNDNQGSSSNFAELDGGGQNPNALNTINPSDIQSIEILKDASATAIYGARGANGVVLITTKRGKAGRSEIALENYYGIQKLSKKNSGDGFAAICRLL